jgi:hypothetical protein
LAGHGASSREKVEIAFVADNSGDGMFHGHILEHQESGMMTVVRLRAIHKLDTEHPARASYSQACQKTLPA